MGINPVDIPVPTISSNSIGMVCAILKASATVPTPYHLPKSISLAKPKSFVMAVIMINRNTVLPGDVFVFSE